MHAFLRDLSQFRQRKNLITAAVRQNRSIPIHELVKAAKMSDDIESGPDEQMIGISEDDLRIQLAQLAWTDRFHAALCPYRHERWCLNHAVPGRQPSTPRFRLSILCEKLKHSLEVSKCVAQEQVTLHRSKTRQRERMGSDFAGLAQYGKSSGQPLVTKVGHFAYWSALVLIFAWAAWLRFRLPLDPIAVPDYVMPALRKLTGAEFGGIHLGRTIFYPGFVYLLVRAFGDFRAITVAQHLLGMLAGGVFLLTWRRIPDFIPGARLPYPIYRCLGLFAVAIYMFSGEPLYFEMSIRPEGICGILISINLYFVIQFAAGCFLEARRTAAVIYGIGVVFSSILLASVKPSFWLTAIVAVLPIGIFFFRAGWFSQKIVLAGGAAVSAALLLLPGHVLIHDNKVHECFLPAELFVIHANLIRDQMAADLERGAKSPYPREWLGHVQAALKAEIIKSLTKGPGNFPTLGFDPDYLMFDQTSIESQLRKEFGNNTSALCAFYWFYYWRIWQQRPLLVVKKIARQMAILLFAEVPGLPAGEISFAQQGIWHERNFLGRQFYSKSWTAYPPAVDFFGREELLARSAPVVEQAAYIRRPLGNLARRICHYC